MKIVLQPHDSTRIKYVDIEGMPQVGEWIEYEDTVYQVDSVTWRPFKQKWHPHLLLVPA